MKKYTPYPIFQEAGRFHDKTTFSDIDKGVAKSAGRVGHMAYGAGILHKQGRLPYDLEAVKETAVMKDIKKVKERRS